jgi:hypothetical protein
MAVTVEWHDFSNNAIRVGKLVSITTDRDHKPVATILTPRMRNDTGPNLAKDGDMIFLQVPTGYLVARGVTIPVFSDPALAPSAPLPDAAKTKFSPRAYDIPIYGDY